MGFEWEGMEELERGLASVSRNASRVLDSALMTPVSVVAERGMKRDAAKDTGQMAARTQATFVSDSEVVWDSDAPYSGYQDLGTALQPGKPFFRVNIIAVARLIVRRTPLLLETSISRVLDSGGAWNPRRLI